MRISFTNTSLIILGAAISFVLFWIFEVGSSRYLIISLLLVIGGALIGFLIEWLVGEKLRQRQEGELPVDKVQAVPLETVQEDPPLQETGPSEETIRQHEAQLQQLSQQLSAQETQFEALHSEFERYRKFHPDPLIRIKGIGPVYQRKLREVGINSFAQLAAADPEELRQALGIKPWQRVKLESWIDQAGDWVNGTNYD